MFSSQTASVALTAVVFALTASAQSTLCTDGPYSSLLPLSKYGVAMAYCSSNYPVPAVTNYKTVQPTTTTTVTATKLSTVFDGTSTRIIARTSTTVATITASPVAARQAQSSPQPGKGALKTLWNSFSRGASPQSMAQACSCIEKPKTTLSTVTGTSTVTIKRTTTVLATTTKQKIVTSTSVKIVQATETVVPPPQSSCVDGQIVVANGKRYVQKCKKSVILQQNYDKFEWSRTIVVDEAACTKYCADVGNCCAAVYSLSNNLFGNCYLTYSGAGCPSYSNQPQSYSVMENRANEPEDSMIYLGLTDPPQPPQTGCEESKVYTWSEGKQYVQKCQSYIALAETAASRSVVRYTDHIAVVNSFECSRVCAQTFENCCSSNRIDAGGLAYCELWSVTSGTCPIYIAPSLGSYNTTTNAYSDSWALIAPKNTTNPGQPTDPPTRTCNASQLITSNGRIYQPLCSTQIKIKNPTRVGVYSSQITYAPANNNITSCTQACAENKDCCLASQWTRPDYSVCQHWYNSTYLGGCTTPITYFTNGTTGEYPAYDPSAIDSAVFVGRAAAPANTRQCTDNQVFTLAGKRYQAKCNAQAVLEYTDTQTQDISTSSPERDTVANCAAYCAAKESCCVAYLMDTPNGKWCMTQGDTAGCKVNGTITYDDTYQMDSIVLVGS